jgi:hypothetical protein
MDDSLLLLAAEGVAFGPLCDDAIGPVRIAYYFRQEF